MDALIDKTITYEFMEFYTFSYTVTFSNVLRLGVMYYSPIKEDPSGKKTHQVWWGSKHLFLLFIFASRSLDIFSKAAFPLKIFHTTKVGDFSQSLKRNIYWYDNFTSNYETLPKDGNHYNIFLLLQQKLLKTFQNEAIIPLITGDTLIYPSDPGI